MSWSFQVIHPQSEKAALLWLVYNKHLLVAIIANYAEA